MSDEKDSGLRTSNACDECDPDESWAVDFMAHDDEMSVEALVERCRAVRREAARATGSDPLRVAHEELDAIHRVLREVTHASAPDECSALDLAMLVRASLNKGSTREVVLSPDIRRLLRFAKTKIEHKLAGPVAQWFDDVDALLGSTPCASEADYGGSPARRAKAEAAWARFEAHIADDDRHMPGTIEASPKASGTSEERHLRVRLEKAFGPTHEEVRADIIATGQAEAELEASPVYVRDPSGSGMLADVMACAPVAAPKASAAEDESVACTCLDARFWDDPCPRHGPTPNRKRTSEASPTDKKEVVMTNENVMAAALGLAFDEVGNACAEVEAKVARFAEQEGADRWHVGIAQGARDCLRAVAKIRERTLVASPAEADVPIVHDFWEGVRAEKAHQIKRWGTTQDRNKAPADWFWLVGYLAGKALASAVKGDREKALHHCISSAAVLAHWHDALGGAGDSLKVEHDPSRASDLETHLGIEPEGDAP